MDQVEKLGDLKESIRRSDECKNLSASVGIRELRPLVAA